MDLSRKRIAVLGGGIGGLTSAIALARRGAQVEVLEQAPAITEIGAGVQISPNGAVVLRALGLGGALERIGTRAQAVELRDYRAGRRVLRLDLTQAAAGGDYLFLHRADLIGALATVARAAGVGLRLSHEAVSVRHDSTGRPSVRTQSGALIRPDILIGADGANSLTRRFLNGDAAPVFSGHVAWRAIVPPDDDPPRVARVFMGPGRHVVTYPLRGGREMNIVAIEERRQWAGESRDIGGDPVGLRRAFGDFCPEVAALLERVGAVRLWGVFLHPVAPVWQSGRVALLGDAAHPMLPALAQGAAMAIEDAWVLADSLGQAEGIEAGLSLYQARRRERVCRVVKAAARNARRYHLRFPPLRFVAQAALGAGGMVAPGAVLGAFGWLYGHDVTARDDPAG